MRPILEVSCRDDRGVILFGPWVFPDPTKGSGAHRTWLCGTGARPHFPKAVPLFSEETLNQGVCRVCDPRNAGLA